MPGNFRTRLRDWLDASLANRMAWSAGTLALGVAATLTVIAFASVGVLLARQMNLSVRAEAEADAILGASALRTAMERVRELARHSMVINGLVDSAGRQAYLVPFIDQDRFHSRYDGALAICDPVGETIASVGQLDNEHCQPIPADASRKSPDLARVTVSTVKAEMLLTVREPIFIEATGSIEGMVIGQARVRRILDDAGIWKRTSLLEAGLGGSSQATQAARNEEGMYRVDATARVAVDASGRDLALRLTHGVPVDPMYLPLAMMALLFLVTLLILVLTVAYLARRQAARLSDPLIRLQEASKLATEDKPVELDRSLIRGDEIGTLATAVKRMADTLQGHKDELEREVARRTAELVAAKETVERINKELQTFAYSVAHDLKAPLRGIDGFSSLLLSEYSDRLDGDGQRYLTVIRKSVSNMGQLIDDLLAYSRLEQREFSAAEVDIAALTGSLIDSREKEIRDAGIAVSMDFPAGSRLRCDRDGLAMILRNLIENAIKFSAKKSAARIEIGAREMEKHWLVSVRDNGIGFDMQYHDRIFAIFQRLHRSEDYPGTGVGLAIVRKTAERMNGRVWAESSPGQGAVFFVELPK